jgi:excisionase family DNA binding protein
MNEMEDSAALARFLTLADTAEILNISAHQAYALVRSGELLAIKIGRSGRWRVERVMLEAFIAAKYEESRRSSLWSQFDFSGLPEYSFDPAARGQARTNNN